MSNDAIEAQTNVIQRIAQLATQNGDKPIQWIKGDAGVYSARSRAAFFKLVEQTAAGFISLGIRQKTHVGIIADNRPEWLLCDLALLSVGAVDVPRGTDADKHEIAYILEHAECKFVIVENEEQARKILDASLKKLTQIIFIDGDPKALTGKTKIPCLTLTKIIEMGKTALAKDASLAQSALDRIQPDDPATIIYTSGTTGTPKGVVLTHQNFSHQMTAFFQKDAPLNIGENDLFLSVLPIWHAYERTIEYIALTRGAAIGYSKPIPQVMVEDIKKINPTIFPSVPRIWIAIREGIYRRVKGGSPLRRALFNFFVGVGILYYRLSNVLRGLRPRFRARIPLVGIIGSLPIIIILLPLKILGGILVFKKIRAALGTRFRFGVSGAGALPQYADEFFAAMGITVLEGYGLTEAAPVVSVRDACRPVPRTVGRPLWGIEARVIGENGAVMRSGQRGVLHIRGKNIMRAYYKMDDETKQILDGEGWLNTGDLVRLTVRNEIQIIGRQKETIVLLGGENVEPSPIEERLLESPYIDNCMVVGQDQNSISVLVVGSQEHLEQYATRKSIAYPSYKELIHNEDIQALVYKEINRKISKANGFKMFEFIAHVTLLPNTFEVGDELTQTLKLRRSVITKKYKKYIEAFYK